MICKIGLRFPALIALGLLLGGLSACGQSGPLTLPSARDGVFLETAPCTKKHT